jgi:hypothetical protein
MVLPIQLALVLRGEEVFIANYYPSPNFFLMRHCNDSWSSFHRPIGFLTLVR